MPDARRPASTSGPLVARAFHIALGASFVVAWLSLGSQIQVLVGSRGLMPAETLIEAVTARDSLSFADFPSLFRYGVSDDLLTAGIWVGVAIAACPILGLYPRIAFAASVLLYLSYAIICRGFLSFQWDNLLLECGALAALLPSDRPARWVHFLLRIALFKLYFESGIAKWQSHLHDWHDGSAMTYYYETAPIPTWVAWYAHQAPEWWHHIESWGTLVFELGGPLLIFGPRPARLTAFVVFNGFQLINISTANYGFFSYLAIVLSLFLLDDRDFSRFRRVLDRRGDLPPKNKNEDLGFLTRLAIAIVAISSYVAISLHEGIRQFWRDGPQSDTMVELRKVYRPLRIVNNYHLFGHITRERIEPEVQTFDGQTWTTFDFHYKPGDPSRAPPFVAPHQPRVDFRLWFYGLAYRRGVQPYVASLLRRVCTDPDVVQPLFVNDLPAEPTAARIAFHQYHFTNFDEKARTGHWWKRREVGQPQTLSCSVAKTEN